MNINRETYETYFMLYADNELSEGMRREVEAFVEQNPDLKPELEIFLSLRLEPDASVQLEDKSFLFRQLPEQSAGLEEQMLLHLDGELPANEAFVLEAAIKAEPSLQTEWEILKKTRLQADTEIRFPGKQVLYRHEAKEIRVVRLSWIRYSAAAAVILIAGLLWLNQGAGPETGVRSIAMNSGNGNAQTEPAGQPTVKDGAPETSAPATASPEIGKEAPAAGTGAIAGRTETRQNTRKEQTAQVAENRPDAYRAEGNNPQIAAIGNPAAETGKEIAAVPQVNASPNINRPSGEVIDQAVGMPEVKADYATQALAGNTDVAEAYNAMDQDTEKSRKGFRGLVRKANRILNKVANPDADRPVVKLANIEITLAQ
jgi:anti-sigma factor RsiW